ncbi:MAG: hypothetical protein QNK24_08100 [Desulfuromusa sp.]|nr:hypothetical protein [Desulfuromusa sp.]
MKRKFKHWTPQYIKNRLALMWFEKNNPDFPWLTKEAIVFLDDWLKPTDQGVEWGSGRSTLWIAKRVGHLLSIEHNDNWYDQTRMALAMHNIVNVDYRQVSLPTRDNTNETDEFAKQTYGLEDKILDFALVDGADGTRAACVREAMRLLRPCGLLILDNANRYISHSTISPGSVGKGFKRNIAWSKTEAELKSWRTIWTSNGVWDTAFFVKEPNSS